MSLPTEISRSFRLYVTHVDGDGHFLRISGQLDQQSSLMVESLFKTARENLEKGIGAVTPGAIQEGIICAAKYKDGAYYRAKVINMSSISNGLVGVHFIDFGNKDIISLSTIRFLDKYDPMFLQLRGQATDYYLSCVINPSGRWEEPILMKLQSLLCYSEYSVALDVHTQTLPLISIQFKGNDLATHLISIRFGMAIPIAKQEILLLQVSENQHVPNWQSNYLNDAPAFSEHVPFLLNQNFPANPASTMRLQHNVALPFNGNIPADASLMNKRLQHNKVSRTSVNLKALTRQPQHVESASGLVLSTPPPSGTVPPFAASKPASPKKSTTYKCKLLELGSQHEVHVSYAEEGPELFAVQLTGEFSKLQDMMDEINRRPHKSLTEPPMIGTVCLGRMSGDRIICRAIVMNLSGSQCKLFFVDFGDTEMISYYDIFDIPEEFVKPNVHAMRFCLSGVKKLEKGRDLNEAFKQLASGNIFKLKVVAPEGPPLIQYGELYLDGKNILDVLVANMKDKLQFKCLGMLPAGAKYSVLVSYVDSCTKFYIQLSDKIEGLNDVMEAVRVHCESSSSPGELPVGSSCCARFPEDGNWYRARVRNMKEGRVTVVYVDYGNEQEVQVSDLRTITPELIKFPAVAMKCALKGFENRPVESKTSNQLEMLALEKTLMCQVASVLSNDTMLVTLVDDSVTPPLDIARKMNQLSQPRSSHEIKATTPVRKDAPDGFTSPEGSVPDEGRKRSFRREKSFKDEWRRDSNEEVSQKAAFQASSPEGSIQDERRQGFRREKSFKDSRRPPLDSNDDFKDSRRPPRDSNVDFPQRGGSFRSRDKENSFDRSGPGRHSDKFGSRPDRGDRNDRNDRRGGSKPWERDNNSGPTPAAVAAPLPADDDWEETPAQTNNNSQPRPHNRDGNRDSNRENRDRDNNRDRRKPREPHDMPGGKPAWKKDTGVGKRLKQAAEGASSDTQIAPRPSVQDRLRRDNNRFNQEGREERSNDDWGNKTGAGRPDRRDNRSDNRGERRENWGDRGQRRDFGNRDRNDFNKDRSDFNSRDRNDFGNRERPERGGRSNFPPRDRAERTFDDNKSDKSFRSQGSGDKMGRAPPFNERGKFTQVQYKEISDPVPIETPFEEPAVELGTQHEVSVTWIISPESFYTQILSLQPKFLEMMHKIPELYKGVKPYSGDLPVGASILARYPADGVLYRATIVSVQPFSKFIVRYVDFGNKQLVDVRDIWQLDRQLMELPKMAVYCSLIGVAPKDGEWKADADIDLCFNAPRYQCVFQEIQEEQYRVFLWNNGVSVADTLVEKELAITAEHQSSVTLKDEPIDMTIIVGQQIVCRVTHVDSYDKFTVQLDIEKAALVEESTTSYDVAKLTPPSPELIVEGTHCTVKHDGKICRAVLQDTSDKVNIKALLADYGNEITTSVDNVMILPTELSVYYYQALQCTMHNYTAESETLMTVEEMRAKLTGNKVIVYVNDVDGITLVVTLYDASNGQKIDIFSPDEGAYDEVIPLCMRAVFNYNFGLAFISHAENLNEFYLQNSSDSDRLALLLDELFKFYEEGAPEALDNFEVDALCAALSSDGNWYRATVISVQDDQVKVHFTDYGNSETVPKNTLKKLDSKFFEPCSLALVASLGLVALQDNAIAKLTEWTTEKEVQVTLSLGTDGWLANLHLDGVDLSIKLINEKLAAPQVASSEETIQEVPAEEQISLPEGCAQMYISHIDTPGHFWLQAVDIVDKIGEIQAELQANADSYADIENREMGTLCIAKYLADDQWYRAEILDSDSDITTVRFIDYGNTDVLDNQPGLIKAIPDNLKEIERYAIKTSVNAVPTGTGEWSEAASEHFTRLVGDLSAPVDVLIVLKDVTTYVDLFVNGVNLTDKLVSEGHAARSEAAECGGDLPSCYASHVNSPSEFWIQLESATPDLQAMESAMVDAENFPELTDKEEGVICAAKYPEDGAWYRAQVIIDGSEGTEVLFMDYGNASIANELRSLPDDLKAKPALSRKCALQKPRDIKSWSRKSEIKFNELAAEGATIFNVQFIASGDISIVELYLEGKSVTEELVGLCEEQPTTERPTPVGQDLHSNAKVCYVQSLDEFYVYLEESLSEIDRVTAALTSAADYEPISELSVGSVCAVLWSEDEQWYRAKILEFCDVGYHVQFIDYGNKAKCEEFRKLPDDLASLEPLAKCCRLAGAPEDKSLHEIGRQKLDEFAVEDITFRIEYLDSSKVPTLVKVLVDGTNLVSILTAETSRVGDTNSETLNKNLEETVPSIPEEDTVEQTETNLDQSNKSLQNTVSKKVSSETEAVEQTNKIIEEMVSETIETAFESATEAQRDRYSKDSKDTVVSDKDNAFNDAEDGLETDKLNSSVDREEDTVEQTETNVDQSNKSLQNTVSKKVSSETEAAEQTNKIIEEMVSETIETAFESATEAQRDRDSRDSKDTAVSDKDNAFNDAEDGLETDKLNSSVDLEEDTVEQTETNVDQSIKSLQNTVFKKVSTETEASEQTNKIVEEMVSETIEKAFESATEAQKDRDSKDLKDTAVSEKEDEFNDAEDGLETEKLNSSVDLDESMDSADTIIMNKSFEAQVDTLKDDDSVDDGVKTETPTTPEKDLSSGSLENSNDSIKTPEKDLSKYSLNTDTGNTSSGEQEKFPDKDIESPKSELASGTFEQPENESEKTKDKIQENVNAKVSELLKESTKEDIEKEVATEASVDTAATETKAK